MTVKRTPSCIMIILPDIGPAISPISQKKLHEKATKRTQKKAKAGKGVASSQKRTLQFSDGPKGTIGALR
jgi:hypothetical protein